MGRNFGTMKRSTSSTHSFFSSMINSYSFKFSSQNDPEKFNTNCFVSQTYFVASELKPTVVFKFMLNGPGVVIVVCSPEYRSSSIVEFNFVSVVIFTVKISFLWI